MTLREAVQYAVRVRLRPILMTSLATIIGLLRILVLLLVVARSAPAEIYHHPGTAARRVKNRISIPDRLTRRNRSRCSSRRVWLRLTITNTPVWFKAPFSRRTKNPG
jgi:hypothetical protein